jgi:hypothetical protein
MGLLDKGNTAKEGLGGRENQALKVVKAKRESEEAGVFKVFKTSTLLRERKTKITGKECTGLKLCDYGGPEYSRTVIWSVLPLL